MPEQSGFSGDLRDFVEKLRRYTRKSVVETGTALLWELFIQRKSNPKNKGDFEVDFLIEALGPHIIMLALATANDHRRLSIETKRDFYALCCDYLDIKASINEDNVLALEPAEIAAELKKLGKIPEEYISADHIWSGGLFLARTATQQNAHHQSGLPELYRDYDVLNSLDKKTNGNVEKFCKKNYGVSLLCLMRACVCLFSLARENRGTIHLKSWEVGQDIRDGLSIDARALSSVAHKLSYREDQLRPEWYAPIFKGREIYWQYTPTPLYKHPLVQLGQADSERYLMPSPALFLRSLRENIFSGFFQDTKTNCIGECFEDHLENALQKIFGAERVERNRGAGADFHVSLDQVELFIEAKVGLATVKERSIMAPEHIAKLWNIFYGALDQCAVRIQAFNSTRLKVAVVIFADDLVAQADPFIQFGHTSGLFEKRGFSAVEIFSWNAFERKLSRVSGCSFERALVDKWTSPQGGWGAGCVLRGEIVLGNAAHNYEYLAEAKHALWPHLPPHMGENRVGAEEVCT